jgi:hypothetical protein
MMFTSSDASSLVRELWWWEHAEYVFGALVAAACAGEYIADFNKRPWVKAHKDRIAKISTLVLVAALVFELICITRANGKSDEVIGKLRDEAEVADNLAQAAVQKSNTALTQSGQAITNAGTASSVASTAKGEADQAAGVANTAKSLADDAKARVADATKKLVVVETQTATLSQQADSLRREIADEKAALESERAKRIRLQRAVSQRSIGRYGSDVLALLKSFVPIDFSVSCTPGSETEFLAGQLGAIPQNAGWKWLGFKPFIKNGNGCAMEKLPEGVTVTSYLGPNGETDSSKDAAEALAHWLRQNGIVAVAYPSGSLPSCAMSLSPRSSPVPTYLTSQFGDMATLVLL